MFFITSTDGLREYITMLLPERTLVIVKVAVRFPNPVFAAVITTVPFSAVSPVMVTTPVSVSILPAHPLKTAEKTHPVSTAPHI